jgi:hypothetical protein
MSTKYLDSFYEKYNIKNLIKILIILIVLFILYRLFTPSISKEYNDIFEGFDSSGEVNKFLLNNTYGNVIFLKDPSNKPIFSNNKFIFILDDTYRIDSFHVTFGSGMKINSLQYMDSLGNLRPISFSSTTSSDILNIIEHDQVDDDTKKPIITSQIVLNIDSNSNPTSTSIKTYGIYGGKQNELRLKSDLNKVSNLIISNTVSSMPTSETTLTSNKYTYPITTNYETDKMIYGIKYTGFINELPKLDNPPPAFEIDISYYNTLYKSNNFNINKTYKLRSDILNEYLHQDKTISANIFFGINDVIIANQIMLSLKSVKDSNGNQYNISKQSITCLYGIPSESDIAAYKTNVDFLLKSSSGKDNTNVFPSIDELINKKYLVKEKDQKDKIDQINQLKMDIQELKNKRQAR